MGVALDVRDAERRHDGQILLERDGADVGQVFAAEDEVAAGLAAAVRDEAGVGDALEHALAVLVARADVAAVQRAADVVGRRAGLVDDHRQHVRPRPPST